jgi:hypothetical protein
MWKAILLCAFIYKPFVGLALDYTIVPLPPTNEIRKASICIAETSEHPSAILVLCPGFNGDGSKLIKKDKWIQFARENNLRMVGVTFESPLEMVTTGCGYFYANRESGQMLLDALDRLDNRKLPILIYGFSAGAHFTSSFEEWIPERILGWCAYSAGWWETPKRKNTNPPGIIACGENDPERYGASLEYFCKGRSLGKPWAWISLENRGHEFSPVLEDFIRAYFTDLISTSLSHGMIYDIDTKELSKNISTDILSVTCWMPSQKTAAFWKIIHKP